MRIRASFPIRLRALLGALALAAALALGWAQQSPAGQFDAFQVTHVRKAAPVAPGESVRVAVKCPSGTVATGGGARVGADDAVLVEFDSATADGRGWEARAEHLDDEETGSASLVVTAVCAKGYIVAEPQAAQRRR